MSLILLCFRFFLALFLRSFATAPPDTFGLDVVALVPAAGDVTIVDDVHLAAGAVVPILAAVCCNIAADSTHRQERVCEHSCASPYMALSSTQVAVVDRTCSDELCTPSRELHSTDRGTNVWKCMQPLC